MRCHIDVETVVRERKGLSSTGSDAFEPGVHSDTSGKGVCAGVHVLLYILHSSDS